MSSLLQEPETLWLSSSVASNGDMTLFPKLKHDKDWDSWQRSTLAQARAQSVEDVFNVYFKPDPNTASGQVFPEQQKYVYAVLETCTQTDKGKDIVRAHSDDGDAKAIYRELCEHATRSTQASLDSSDILTHITTSRLDDGKWKGTFHSYLLHWTNQVWLYEKLVDQQEPFLGASEAHPSPKCC